jgi:hypothetical protein
MHNNAHESGNRGIDPCGYIVTSGRVRVSKHKQELECVRRIGRESEVNELTFVVPQFRAEARRTKTGPSRVSLVNILARGTPQTQETVGRLLFSYEDKKCHNGRESGIRKAVDIAGGFNGYFYRCKSAFLGMRGTNASHMIQITVISQSARRSMKYAGGQPDDQGSRSVPNF